MSDSNKDFTISGSTLKAAGTLIGIVAAIVSASFALVDYSDEKVEGLREEIVTMDDAQSKRIDTLKQESVSRHEFEAQIEKIDDVVDKMDSIDSRQQEMNIQIHRIADKVLKEK